MPKKSSTKAAPLDVAKAVETNRGAALSYVRVIRKDMERMSLALDKIEKAIRRGKFRLYAMALSELTIMDNYVTDAVRALPTSVANLAHSLGLASGTRKKKGRRRKRN